MILNPKPELPRRLQAEQDTVKIADAVALAFAVVALGNAAPQRN